MYGKLFVQMYDGSLYGKWQALVTFQQLIVLADVDGVVDMTPQALAARTSIPLQIIRQGLDDLEQPDPDSRSTQQEGRRIVRLSEHRAWGWRLTNYEHYRQIRSVEDRRQYMREYMRDKRSTGTTSTETSVNNPSTDVNNLLAPVSNVSLSRSRSRSKKEKRSADADATDQSQASKSPAGFRAAPYIDAWREIRKGTPPAGQIAKYLKLVETEVGPDEAQYRWRRFLQQRQHSPPAYFAQEHGQYAEPPPADVRWVDEDRPNPNPDEALHAGP